jgi:glycosyltransferase involved in cell wall biosynthesis
VSTRVLHVTEAMGGGVITSLLTMVDATPELEHHLLARPRGDSDTGDDWSRSFTTSGALPANALGAVAAVRRAVGRIRPDAVHAHSSIAGAVVRAAGLRSTPVVYSPHCFPFERRETGPLQRAAYRLVERMLVPRTDVLAAVSPHELDLAVELGHREVTYVANRTLGIPDRAPQHRPRLRIVTVGRVCAQKDWRFFLHVKRCAESQMGLRADWEWLGGGDPDGEEALRRAGVRVSGWIPRVEVLDRLAGAQVYLHTAAWEAAPVSVLEAAAIGLPLVVRAIPSLRSLGIPGSASVMDVAEQLRRLEDPAAWRHAQRDVRALHARHSRETQAHQLLELYRRVTRRRSTPVDRLAPLGAPLLPEEAVR